ncbi:MAG: hypothetical protein VXZ67_01790, partial [Pseudomonadota bacterium]|nr:hypothetical protein [Pseudomonadota bacterium]
KYQEDFLIQHFAINHDTCRPVSSAGGPRAFARATFLRCHAGCRAEKRTNHENMLDNGTKQVHNATGLMMWRKQESHAHHVLAVCKSVQVIGRHAIGSSGTATGGSHLAGAVRGMTFPRESFHMDRVRRLCKKEDRYGWSRGGPANEE